MTASTPPPPVPHGCACAADRARCAARIEGCAVLRVGISGGMRGDVAWDARRDARFRRLECTVGCTEMRLGMRCGMRCGMRGGAAWNALRMATVAHGLPCLQEDVSRAFSKTVRSVDCFT